MIPTSKHTRDQAIARARIVQVQISHLRRALLEASKGFVTSYLVRGGAQSINAAHALLQSYDAEMTRLCEVPDVLSTLLADATSLEDTKPPTTS